jgi:hypothetical protein
MNKYPEDQSSWTTGPEGNPVLPSAVHSAIVHTMATGPDPCCTF